MCLLVCFIFINTFVGLISFRSTMAFLQQAELSSWNGVLPKQTEYLKSILFVFLYLYLQLHLYFCICICVFVYLHLYLCICIWAFQLKWNIVKANRIFVVHLKQHSIKGGGEELHCKNAAYSANNSFFSKSGPKLLIYFFKLLINVFLYFSKHFLIHFYFFFKLGPTFNTYFYIFKTLNANNA